MKDAVVVLGMHRSGTSAVTGTLTLLGAARPKSIVEGDTNNERGYFESRSIMNLNDEILASAGSSWNDWRSFNPNWLRTAVADDFRDRAASILLEEFRAAPLIALKDPRICRIAPFWFSALSSAGYRSRSLIVVRNPLEVAASLRKRDGLPVGQGLLIWLRHVLEAECRTRNMPRSILIWSHLLEDWRGAFERVSRDLELDWPRQSDFSADEIDAFFSDELRHHRVDDRSLQARPDVNEWAKAAFEALKLLSTEPNSNSARSVLDAILTEFEKTARIYGPAFSGLERELQERELGSERFKQVVSERAEAVARVDELELHANSLAEALNQANASQLTLQRECQALADELYQASANSQTRQSDEEDRERIHAGQLEAIIEQRDAERNRSERLEIELSQINLKVATREEEVAVLLKDARAEAVAERDRATRFENDLDQELTQARTQFSALQEAMSAKLELALAESVAARHHAREAEEALMLAKTAKVAAGRRRLFFKPARIARTVFAGKK